MRRVFTAVASAIALPADQNNMQDRIAGLVPATNTNELTTATTGVDELFWQSNASIAAGTLVQFDTNDWHDRTIEGWVFQNRTANTRIGQAADYNFDHVVSGTEFSRFVGYLGKGGYSTTGGVAVSNGNPPVRGTAAFTSWYVNGTTTAGQILLYVDPTSNKLYVYNNTGFATQLTIYLRAVQTGLRP